MQKEKNTISGNGRPADNYPTDHHSADNYPTDHHTENRAKDSSRYSHPDQRPDKNGPGGE